MQIQTFFTPSTAAFVAPYPGALNVSLNSAALTPEATTLSVNTAAAGTVIKLTGSYLDHTSRITFNGYNVTFAVTSATELSITIPTVAPAYVFGKFVLMSSTGYVVYSPSFTVFIHVTSIAFPATALTACRGQVISSAVIVTPSNATDPRVTLASFDSNIVTVDASGNLIAVSLGDAVITATAVDGGFTSTRTVHVSATRSIAVRAVQLASKTVTIDKGSSSSITVVPENGVVTPDLTWSSNDTSVATVSGNGVITGIGYGSATVTATPVTPNSVSSTIQVRVVVPVTMNDTSDSISGLTTTMQYSTNNGITWTTYSGNTGIVTGFTGNRRVIVRDGTNANSIKQLVFTDSYAVTNPVTTVLSGVTYLSDLQWSSQSNGWGSPELDSSNNEYGTGDGRQMKINGVTYARGIGAHAPAAIEYKINGKFSNFTTDVGPDDETSGSVTFSVYGDGVLLAPTTSVLRKSNGAKRIAVSVAGVQTLRLVVGDGGDSNSGDHADFAGAYLQGPVSSLSLSVNKLELLVGATGSVSGSVSANIGTIGLGSRSVTWTTSDSSIFTVSATGTSAVVTAVAAGIARLIVTSVADSTVTASIPIFVSPKSVWELYLSISTVSLAPGQQYDISSQISYKADAGYTPSFVYSVVSGNSVSVSATGLVSSTSLGTSTVRVATSNGAYRAEAVISVTTMRPTLEPTSPPVAQDTKVSFDSSLSLSGLTTQSLDAPSLEAVLVATAKSMGVRRRELSVKSVSFSSRRRLREGERKSKNDFVADISSSSSRQLTVYTANIATSCTLLMSDYSGYSPSSIFNLVTSNLAAASSSGALTAAIQSEAANAGVTSLSSASCTGQVTSTSPLVETTGGGGEDNKGLSQGAIAGIAIAVIAVVLITSFVGGYVYLRGPSSPPPSFSAVSKDDTDDVLKADAAAEQSSNSKEIIVGVTSDNVAVAVADDVEAVAVEVHNKPHYTVITKEAKEEVMKDKKEEELVNEEKEEAVNGDKVDIHAIPSETQSHTESLPPPPQTASSP